MFDGGGCWEVMGLGGGGWAGIRRHGGERGGDSFWVVSYDGEGGGGCHDLDLTVKVFGRSWGLMVVAVLVYGSDMVVREGETHFEL